MAKSGVAKTKTSHHAVVVVLVDTPPPVLSLDVARPRRGALVKNFLDRKIFHLDLLVLHALEITKKGENASFCCRD